MREQTLKKAIFKRFAIVILLTAVLSSLLSSVFLAVKEEEQVRILVEQKCKLASYQYEKNHSAKELSQIVEGDRITIISQTGDVLDDSEHTPSEMENHRDRYEVINATKEKVATQNRTSQTLSHPYMYGAIVLKDNTILRLAHPYNGLFYNIISHLPALIISFLLVALLCFFINQNLNKKIVSPLEDFSRQISLENYDNLKSESGYLEINQITRKIKKLLESLKKARIEIEEQNDKTNFILSNMSEGVVFLDQSKKVTLMNQSAERIFEIDQSVVGHSLTFFTKEKALISAVEEAISQRVFSVIDLSVGNSTYSVHVSPVDDKEAKKVEGVTLFLVDVGKERENERQRTEFFSNASHELKTPITSVLGFSEMLQNGSLSEDKKEKIYSHLVTETKRMNQLINDILTISRLESGIVKEEQKPVELTQLATEVVEILRPQAKGQEILLEIEKSPIFVYAGHRQLQDIFNNLIENAMKYNKEQGKIWVVVKKREGRVDISVKDTGIGIAKEAQKRIFERFYRVDSGRTKTTGGTGLGLAIVKHIVLSLRGKIHLESEPNVGTEVVVSLPLYE